MHPELRRLLLHPLLLLALALWALNDHYLKAAWGNAFTGKLSDVCSMMVAPVLLAALCTALGLGRRHVGNLLAAWCVLMMLVMFSIKLFEPAADCYRVGLALLQWPFRSLHALTWRRLTPVLLAMDPSDLWTLPCALTPLWLLARQRGVRPSVPRAASALAPTAT